jgi:hypothetical protein
MSKDNSSARHFKCTGIPENQTILPTTATLEVCREFESGGAERLKISSVVVDLMSVAQSSHTGFPPTVDQSGHPKHMRHLSQSLYASS